MISELLVSRLGTSGVLIGATVMGLADAHAAAVSTATLTASGRVGAVTGAMGVLLALTTNMAIKIPVAFMSGSRRFAARTSFGILLLLGALWAGYAFVHD